ncbi:MAG: hypothetical protein ACRDPQ_17205 [Nocardioidaceae bacterium]
MAATEDSDRLAKDLEAIVAARSDLDSSYEPALVEAFLERVDEAVDKRVESELKAREAEGFDKEIAFTSMALGIPITVVAGIFGDVYGIAAAWTGIVGVNIAAALGGRRKRRR